MSFGAKMIKVEWKWQISYPIIGLCLMTINLWSSQYQDNGLLSLYLILSLKFIYGQQISTISSFHVVWWKIILRYYKMVLLICRSVVMWGSSGQLVSHIPPNRKIPNLGSIVFTQHNRCNTLSFWLTFH